MTTQTMNKTTLIRESSGCRDLSARTAIFSLVWVCLFLSGCGEQEIEKAAVARPVKMLTIGDMGAGGTREYPGEVSAAQNADMAFEVSGKIIAFPVKEGQEVTKGTLLAQLDPRDFNSARDAVAARRNAAKADYERYQDLYERDATSRQQLDVARRNYEVAQADLRTAQKAVEDTTLKAPFDGKMAKKLVEDPPVNVQAKQPVLILQDVSSLKININIPERDWAKARPGLTLAQRTANAKPMVVISSIPDRKFPATLTEAATTADPDTRTYQATLAFENPKNVNIHPGMTAKVVVTLPDDGAKTARTISLPASAVLSDDKGAAFVWKVDPASMTVQQTPVVMGELSGMQVGIESGLSNGDLVAISGVHKLRDGMLVRKLEY